MKIPFLDLKKQYLSVKDEVSDAIGRVLDDSAYSGGPYVDAFEAEFAKYCGVKYSTGVSSGTDALHLAMRTLDIEAGDEVILPVNTFVATAWGVSYVNAKPVFVDCDPESWNIDHKAIESKITDKTKAIIGVHLYGQPFDADEVKKIARKYNLKFVEDCAQAVGALYKGRRVGSLSDVSCFSFYPGKNLGAYGEAGGLATDNAEYDKRIRSLRNHGSLVKYYHEELGFNMRMDGIHGAVLSIKLKYLDEWNEKRRSIAKSYRQGIKNPKLKMQRCPDFASSVYHLFVITTEDRDGLKSYLEAKGIYPGIHYPVPCHLQKAYAHLGYKKGDFPNAEHLSRSCLSLPMYPELTEEEVAFVIDALNRY
ncbi:MAG: DegT/DnrJ/EryC1/StrS family aminotransferase [Deltaproteobacteria bacterium]|nr:DegT/DnrJ/EryC1/StrS family aminotransferase [Deltaproteobacteria bacterium]